MDKVIEVYARDVDRTLIQRNLRLTPTERIEKLIELLETMEALKNAPRSKP